MLSFYVVIHYSVIYFSKFSKYQNISKNRFKIFPLKNYLKKLKIDLCLLSLTLVDQGAHFCN